MADARNRMHQSSGNLMAHDHSVGNSGQVRNNANTNSNISWSTPQGAQPYDFKGRDTRAK